MQTPLQELFHAIAQVQDETELRQPIMAKAGTYFVANRWKLWLLDDLPPIDEKMPTLMKRALSLDYNPVLRYLVQRHAAVHDEAILPPGIWQRICPRADHGHVLVGPIVSHGKLVGGIAFTRRKGDLAFNSEHLTDLSALCLHFSTRLETLRSKPIAFELNCARLTPRETEIAEWVARGLTNKEIGAALWITENSVKQALKRMFRKLEVSSRAEMVAQLSMSPKKTAV
ncbi:LuxR family transcriptional regulator [Lusitaniella coriacea LEGE 07157]|uniref:LuxR family transcriptional regulator n=1 Tax=Lusitaniella coriacea LEGE 07157 TaxID=945747 RepID=A0A8J7JC47_9CYAN|nr:LuxR C-terminal-related transcriptional regulator [Lusitaniella coriacea]MBE9117195.1 LuxR family transcriptional regulator [Lusitaniella coriacea LEGE 07157]